MRPTFVIVGLGNHGKAYEQTRHNLGYRAVDRLAQSFATGTWMPKQKFTSQICEGRVDTVACLFVKPETYMNLSGEAIEKLLKFYKLNPKVQLLVIADDVDIPLGTYRLRMNGGPGTHNGMKSIVERLGEDFPRLRIGLGPQPKAIDLSAWVLSALSAQEKKKIDPIFDQLPTLMRLTLREIQSSKA